MTFWSGIIFSQEKKKSLYLLVLGPSNYVLLLFFILLVAHATIQILSHSSLTTWFEFGFDLFQVLFLNFIFPLLIIITSNILLFSCMVNMPLNRLFYFKLIVSWLCMFRIYTSFVFLLLLWALKLLTDFLMLPFTRYVILTKFMAWIWQ